MKSPKEPKLKLWIEMIPPSSWGKSVRTLIPKSRWNKVKEAVHEENGRKCEVCSSTLKLNCHEQWHFDDELGVQHLVGLGTLCNMCHLASHLGRAEQLAAEGYVDLDAIVSHFMKVNGCTREMFLTHEREASALFAKRSSREWLIDYGEYAQLVAEYAMKRGLKVEIVEVQRRR